MATTHDAGPPDPDHLKNGREDGRINILFIINDLKIGGAEKMLIYLISGLNRKIYNPIVCTLLDRGEYRHYLKTHGIKYYTLNMQNYFKIPGALFKLVRIIKKENINMIHSYLFYSDLLARLSGFLARVPVVITSMRNIDLWRKYHHIFLDSLTYKLSSAIISNSLAGAERLYNVERIPSEKIKVVYNAIKLDEYLPAENYDRSAFRKTIGLSDNDIAVTTVARLEEQKDHFTLLRAARHLLDEIESGAGYAAGKKLKFLIVGDGSLFDEIRDRAKELKLDDSVMFLGQRTDIKNILNASDIFLLTSVYEGIPNAILEAQACGVPVVATDVGGVSEIIENNFNGMIAKPSDHLDISAKVRYLISNPALAKRIAVNAFEKLKVKFSTESLISKTEAIYRGLLVQNSPEIAHGFFNSDEFNLKFNILYLITSSDVGGAQKHLISLVKHFLSKNYQIKVVTSPGEPMNSSLKKLGIMPVTLKHLQKSVNPFYDLMAFYEISRLLLDNNFHIIHCHSTKAGIIGRIAAFFAGVPVKIFTAHGFVFHDNMNFIKRYLCVLAEKIGAIFCDGIITVSWADLKKAIKYKIANKNLFKVIHNGIDPAPVESYLKTSPGVKALREKYGVPSDALVLGSVGRLVYEKSYDIAIKAFSKVLSLRPGAVMVIAGEGYERKKLESLAESLNITKSVIFLGEVTDIFEVYSMIDIFFLSSVKEGLPYSLLEAGCFALPSVLTRAGGIMDVAVDGNNAVLAGVNDADALFSSFMKMVNMTPEERRGLGAELKTRIMNEFTERKMLAGVESLYARLAAGKGLMSDV